MHHLIERSIQKYRLTNGPLRCLAPSDPCGLRSGTRKSQCQPVASTTKDEKTEAK